MKLYTNNINLFNLRVEQNYQLEFLISLMFYGCVGEWLIRLTVYQETVGSIPTVVAWFLEP